jgi:outer membrane lipopolysaccharide assembly protein LptE/RlpB
MINAGICRKGLRVLLVAWVFLIAGCGYTTRSLISEKFRTIYIAPFANKIDITRDADAANKYKINKPMIETDVTKTVVSKFLIDGNLKPAKEQSADLILKGEVVEFRQDPLRYTESDEVEEYRLNVIVNISLWDRKENKMLWEERNFTGYYDYFTTYATASSVTKKTTDQATPDAINDLARRIVERTVEEW